MRRFRAAYGAMVVGKDSSISEHIGQMRLSATITLKVRRDAAIVGTVSTIHGIGDRPMK